MARSFLKDSQKGKAETGGGSPENPCWETASSEVTYIIQLTINVDAPNLRCIIRIPKALDNRG